MVMPTDRIRRFRRPVRRSLADAWAMGAIAQYQRHLSPRKGYACAHRMAHGGESCSEHIKGLIARHGLMQAVTLAPDRFRACRDAYFLLRAAENGGDDGAEGGDNGGNGDRDQGRCGTTLDCLTCGDDYNPSGACLICGCLEAIDDIVSSCG
jgi:putative component of membrane protein insertase Oxa1/YidC/SpoIIIJ protein YidD